MRTLRFEVDITDEQAAALEEIRPFLVEDGQTGLAPDSTIEEVYVDCAARVSPAHQAHEEERPHMVRVDGAGGAQGCLKRYGSMSR